MSGQQNYTAEEHAAAWAEYYRQQGYDSASISAALGSNSADQTYTSTSTTTTQQYGTAQPGAYETYIPPTTTTTAGPSSYPTSVAGPSSGSGINDLDWIQQSSAYLPGAAQEIAKNVKSKVGGKRETVIRHGKGKTWEDPTLLDWDPKWYRLFVGDVSNDVNERTLDTAFSKYPTYCKCKVVRDRLSLKSKYAFIAFKDPEDFLKAWKEMDGKYVGNRPIRLSKIRDDQHGTIATVKVGAKKARELDKLRKNRGKPLDGRPTPW